MSNKTENMSMELTQGEDPDGKECQGIIIWTGYKSEKKAKKFMIELNNKLNEIYEKG